MSLALDRQSLGAQEMSIPINGDGFGISWYDFNLDDEPCQFRSVQGLACDRLGLLYVIDSSRGDLQVIDFRGSNAVAGPTRKASDLGVRKLESFAVGPDGEMVVFTAGTGIGWRW